VGFGVITELSTGYPGYDSVLGPENATIGTILRDNGYATSWFGKNHNTPGFQYSTAGPFDQWPSGMGFEYFYGFMGGETDQRQPYLFRDHTQIFPWVGKPGYNLTTDMADEAINYMKELNAVAPEKPFFVYYVPGGGHSPHHPTQEWIDKFKGKFDMGWNELREQIFANQKKLDVIPDNAQLTPWPDDLKKWDALSADEKKLFARQAEVFAGYTAYTDYEIGRVIQAVEDMGKLDNTLIIYICGDNGTSPEGTQSVSVGKVRMRSRRASTPSCSTSPMTVPASPRAARGRQGSRQPEDSAHHCLSYAGGRNLRRRRGHPHRSGRQGLPGALPLHGQARQADRRTRRAAAGGRGP
jgi:arylsulfatase